MVCILNMGSTSQIASHHTSAFVVAGMLEEHIYIFYHPRVESLSCPVGQLFHES